MLNLILKNASHLEDYIDQLKEKYPDKIYVTIRTIKGISASRKEYFARIGEFAEEMGYNKKEMHEFIKDNVLPSVTSNIKFIQDENGLNSTSTTVLNEEGYTKLLLVTEQFILSKLDKII